MKAFAPLGLLLVLACSKVGNGFEPYDYKKVPFPGSDRGVDAELTGLVEALTDVASIADLPDRNKARVLAAARRVSPLDRRAFVAEYQLSIGEKPSPASPLQTESIQTHLQPHMVKLGSIHGAKDYIDFVTRAVDPNARFADKPVPSPKKIGENACGLLTMEGCVTLGSNSTAIPGSNFQFSPGNLKTGIFMSAYRESLKFLALNGNSGLSGRRLYFLTDVDLTGGEEGPSAALACAVLTGAMAEKFEIDSRVAFSGDVNADGSVQPLYDEKDRLLANPETLHDIIIIPKADHDAADDILLLQGPWLFSRTQLIGVKTLGDAIDIAKKNKEPDVLQALAVFADVQKVLNQSGGRKFLKNSHVRKRLDKVLELMPNHISASQLNRASQGRYPASLSLNTSFELIFKALKPVFADGKIDQNARLDKEALKRLKTHRSKIDPEVRSLADAAFSFETSGRIGAESSNERARLKQRLIKELNAVSRNVKIREKMM